MFLRPAFSFAVAATGALMACSAAAAGPRTCRQVTLTGEVAEGHEWKAAFGQGWIFRVLPIQPGPLSGQVTYSGWDLAVDREPPAGFPDALLVATPPYNSLNEREIGTTFGLRAQDVIGWNPRSFRFLIDPEALRESRKLFQVLAGPGQVMQGPVASSREEMAIQRQLKINQESASGQFRILDARLTPGIADAARYAESSARAAQRTPHTVEPPTGGRPSPRGQLHWMKFSITLWLPQGWKVPKDIHAVRGPCAE